MTSVRSVPSAWRVVIARSGDDALEAATTSHGLLTFVVPTMVPTRPSDPDRLAAIARALGTYEWVICSSVNSVRGIANALGAEWPANVRTAAVGPATAAALVEAGAREPVIADTFNARALLEKLKPLDSWQSRRVLAATVAGGRRDLIDGLRLEGADVTEVEAYAMAPRSKDEIARAWHHARPDALIVGSPKILDHLMAAVGADAARSLKAVVALGPSTLAACAAARIPAEQSPSATFADAIAHIAALRDRVNV